MSADILNLLVKATLMTLSVASASLIIGMFLSIFFVALETSKIACVRKPTTVIITLLRGLPEILVVFLIYFGLMQIIFLITDEFVELNAFWCGAIALGIIFAAYASQSLRGAIKAIPLGQWESGSALGLNRKQVFVRIVLPQVWRHALPGLSNQWLVLLKDTALVSLIGVDDLLRQSELINANTHQPFTWFGIVALIYLAITLVSQRVINVLEARFTRFERGVA